MNWLYYLGEANLYLIVFYLGYCLFLSKETHYTLNRIYLLSSCVFAFVLPLLQLGFLKPNIELTPEMLNPNLYPDGPEAWQQNLMMVYVCGACVFALLFFIKLFKLWVIIRQSYISKLKKHKLIHIDEPNTAFSFFNYLFIAEETERVDFITHHELVHIRQKHSADIIFTEILKVISWFNPVMYLVQRSLKNVHEFIADENTASVNNDRLAYSAFLINNAYGLGGSSVTHSFFNHNLLKRRILMLNCVRSDKLSACKYLLIAPLFAGMLFTSTVSFSKDYGWFDVAPMQVPPPSPPKPPVKPISQTLQPPPAPPHPPANTKRVAVPDVEVKKTPDVVKFPRPVVTNGKRVKVAKPKNTDRVKFPPGTVLPTPAAKPEKKVVRIPPPVVVPNKPVGQPITKRPPPPPPQPPKSDEAIKPKTAARIKFPRPVVKEPHTLVYKLPPPVVAPNKSASGQDIKRMLQMAPARHTNKLAVNSISAPIIRFAQPVAKR